MAVQALAGRFLSGRAARVALFGHYARFETFLPTLRDVETDPGVGADLKVGPHKGLHHAVEFRDPSWYDERVYALLRRYKVALCLHDMEGSATGRIVVGPFVSVRFHHGTKRYGGRYSDARLDAWAEWLTARADEGLDVFAYFNNDTGGHAPRDAIRLRQRC